MNEVLRVILKIFGIIVIVFFSALTLLQVFFPDMFFGLVSLRNRFGRKSANLIFLGRNMLLLILGVFLICIGRF